MAFSVPRPQPIGVSRRGIPIWAGEEFALYREASDVTAAQIARALQVQREYVSLRWESGARARSYEEALRYFKAVEHSAEGHRRRMDIAREKLAELRAAREAQAAGATR